MTTKTAPSTTTSSVEQLKERLRPWAIGFRRTWEQFTESSLGIIGLLIIVTMIGIAVFAPYLAPHSLDWQAFGSDRTAEQIQSLPHPPAFVDPRVTIVAANNPDWNANH